MEEEECWYSILDSNRYIKEFTWKKENTLEDDYLVSGLGLSDKECLVVRQLYRITRQFSLN
jgi:hypothetical protein